MVFTPELVKNDSHFEAAVGNVTDLVNIELVGNVSNLSSSFLLVLNDAHIHRVS